MLALPLHAQQVSNPTPSPAVAPNAATTEPAIELSPFEVRASTDVGYQATETLAGSRLNTSLKDVATQINVMTPEFLEDLAVTDLSDAVRYSLNNENIDDTFALENPGNAALRDTIGYGANTTRTRNLSNSNATHDFFDTNIRIDGYNTERFSFASGPNSILFGNSSPGGTVDTTFKRASTARRRDSVQLRVDDLGSVRTVVDLDHPLIKDKLGLRFVQLRDRGKDWREPAFNNQDRYFATLTFKPIKQVSMRGYFERTFNHLQTAINTTMQDHITPWIEAGRPTYANGPTFVNPAASSVFVREQPANNARPYVFLDASGAAGRASPQANSVAVKGHDALLASPNNFERSILDESLFPFDVSPAGNGNQSKVYAWIRGAVVEFNPIKNLFVEAAVNQEQLRQRGAGLFRGTDMDFRVDPNQFLDDRVTPNPNVGRYYFQANQDPQANSRTTYSTRNQRRLAVSYDLDFTKRERWTKWLGRHRLAGLYEELTAVTATQNQAFRLVSNGTVNFAAAGQPILRYYLTPGEDPWPKLPFDPLASGIQALPGTNATGQPLQIVGQDSPFGATAAAGANRKRQLSSTFAMQSWFLDGRVVGTYGRRRDHVKLYEHDAAQMGATVAGGGFVHLNQILASDSGITWGKIKDQAPVTTLKGVVVHPFRWISLSYSEADSQIVGTGLPRKLDGTIAPSNAGEGKDYGITLRLLNDRLSIRYSRYEVTNANSGSSLGLNNPVGQLAVNWGPNIRHNIASIDRSIQLATGQTGTSTKYQWFLDTLTRIPDAGGSAVEGVFGQGHNDLAFQSNRVSKGDEITLVGNPTERWRISLGLAQSESKESNIAPEYEEYIKERIPVWEQHLDSPLRINTPPVVAGTTATIRQLLEGGMLQNLNFIKYAAGKPLARERKYRVTVVSSYRFEQGRLKGANVGGAFMWRSPAAVGYPEIQQSNFYPINGVAAGNLTMDDQENPYRGGGLVTFDAFTGYGKKILGGKVLWRAQLNIRNLLDATDPQVQRVTSNGAGAIYTIPAPRTFILTNTFSF